TMRTRLCRTVAVDWQVELANGADPAAVAATVAQDRYVRASEIVGLAATTGLHATTGATTQTTGPGVVIGLPDRYRTIFPTTIRTLLGPDRGVLLTQQTAANLHAGAGDMVTVGRAGLDAATVRVEGVVDIPQADSFLQPVGLSGASLPQAPPDNVLIVPITQWHQLFDPLSATRPDQVRDQVHARINHHLPHDPAPAFTEVVAAARHLEVKL